MKEEKNNNEIPSPEDFWPEAEVLLNSHFAKRKKVSLLFAISIFFAITSFGLFLMNHHNQAHVEGRNYNKTRTKLSLSNRLMPRSTIINSNKRTNESLDANNIGNNSKVVICQNVPLNISKKVEKNKNENLIAPSFSKQQNQINSNTNKNEIGLIMNFELSEISANIYDSVSAETPFPMHFSKISLLSYNLKGQKANLYLAEDKQRELDALDDYFKNKKSLHYWIGAYAGIQTIGKQIKSNEKLTEYADIRNASENKINTVYAGINVTINHKHLLLQSGIEYNSVGEQNNYEAKSKQWQQNDEKVWGVYNKQIIKIDTVYHWGIVNYNQTIVNVKDSTLQTKSDSVLVYQTDSNIINANKKTIINSFEIPLMIGYQYKFRRLSVSAFAGISVGYFSKINGMYINKSITGIEEIQNSMLLNNFNFNYQLKLQLSYQINDNLMLSLTPQLRKNLLSVNPKSSGISTKYSAFGTSFGLSYKL